MALETRRDTRDLSRPAHNPEVAGSNPAPATKAMGPFLEQRKGPWHVVCARICKRALGHVATLASPLTVAAWSPARLTRDLGGGERAAADDQLGERIRDLTVGLQVGLIIPPATYLGKPSRPGPSGQGGAARATPGRHAEDAPTRSVRPSAQCAVLSTLVSHERART